MEKRQSTTLYLEHFGLTDSPFKITPTTDFFYGGGRRIEILNALLYAIESGEGIAMVTGEVGSGKTMMLRTLIEKLPDNIDIIYIANPSLSGREIIYHICEELELHIDASRPDTVRLLQNHLIEQHSKRRRVVAFIDEAQAMPDDSLEEIRLLSNLETNRDKLLQIILFGQPELEEKISQQSMRQLRERITVALQLQPFDRDDVREYISTRMRVAGYNGHPIFSKEACQLIAIISQGLSRRINVLADRALLSAYGRGVTKVNRSDAQRAVKDANFGKMRYRSEQSKRFSKNITIGVTTAACFSLLLVIGLYFVNGRPTVSSATVVSLPSPSERTVTVTADDPTNTSKPAATTRVATATVDLSAVVIPLSTQPVLSLSVVDGDTMVSLADTTTLSSPTLASEEKTVEPMARQTNTHQDMVAAITSIKQGSIILNGEILAQQLAENAETHTTKPDIQGETIQWDNDVPRPQLDNNKNWAWMPRSSYLRGRLNATETWLKKNRRKKAYTARLVTVSQERSIFLEKFLHYFANFYPIRNAMVYPVHLTSGEKFVVTFGVYENRKDADVFLSHIPYYFTGGKPFAQKIDDIIVEADYTWN